jgi:hypothetical protein
MRSVDGSYGGLGLVQHTHLTLGKWKAHPRRRHRLVPCRSQVALDLPPVIKVVWPGEQREIDGAVAIAREEGPRGRIRQHLRVRPCHPL